MARKATFNRYVIDPTTSEKTLQDHTTQQVTVLREIEATEDGTPMFEVIFPDGFTASVFEDELTDWTVE